RHCEVLHKGLNRKVTNYVYIELLRCNFLYSFASHKGKACQRKFPYMRWYRKSKIERLLSPRLRSFLLLLKILPNHLTSIYGLTPARLTFRTLRARTPLQRHYCEMPVSACSSSGFLSNLKQSNLIGSSR